MQYLVLGHVEVQRPDGAVAIPSFKQRSLLSLLLIHANQVVSTDRIIDELWDEAEPADRRNALWVHVSNLRAALEPGRERRAEGGVLRTQPPGYLLEVGPDELDAARFERLVGEGRSLLDHDPAAASLVVGEALALWRGHAYEDVTFEAFAQPEIARLEELRLEAVELRIDADLRRGMASELVGELESLVRQHPLREALTAALMVALHRSGRQADALRAYRRLRASLGDELGLEPSAALRRLEERIVVGDPTLEQSERAGAAPTRVAVRGYELREPLGDGAVGRSYRAYQPAVGREVEVQVVDPVLADDVDFIRSFEAAAERVARLDHPHLVRVLDHWREPHGAYLVRELVLGPRLSDAVGRRSLPQEEVARIGAGVAAALAQAHRSGVVHGTLGPSSITLAPGGRAMLADVGLAGLAGRQVASTPDRSFLAPEVRSGGPATAAGDQYGLAATLRFALTGGTGPGTGWQPDPHASRLASVLDRATSADPTDRYPDVSAFQAALAATAGQVPTALGTPANPYKGLRAFGEVDAADFFGRERVVERLVARLGDPAHGRFVALVGPSGSGKSSAVHAGLLPALRRGAVVGSATWFQVSITPGSHPFEELEDALARIAVHPPSTLLELLLAGDTGIRRAVARVLPDEQSQVLLVIDQLEELFTQADEPTAAAFLRAVAAAVDDRHSNLRVVATLRADFYDRPLRHRAFGELLRRGTEVITPLSPAELERAVDDPAERLGVRFEPGLVAQIVADVADHEGALPLLQYALTELFDQRTGGVIELSAYRRLGGVAGALVRRAEAMYAGFDDDEREAVRQVLLRLVEPGEGTRDVRRRVPRSRLLALGGPAVERVIEALGQHRLLGFDRDPVTREPTVEIAHEALVNAWDRYRRWVEQSGDDLRLERRLAAAAAEWEAAGREPSYLLDGPHLDQLAGWAATTDLTLGERERAFLAAGEARRRDAIATDEARARREQRLRRQARRRNRVLAIGTPVLAVMVALAGVALVERNKADRSARQLAASDEARRLAASATAYSVTNPALAMLLALQSLDESRRGDIPAAAEAEEALHWALQAARIPYPRTDAPAQVRFGPNGPTGIFALPLNELVDLVRGNVGRTLTADECDRFAIAPCPTTGLASPAGDVALPAPPVVATPEVDGQALAGTRITLAVGTELSSGLKSEIDRFEQRTGIEVAYQANADFNTVAREALATRRSPDLAFASQPGAVREYARLGQLIDLGAYVDQAGARRAFGDYLVDQTTLGSALVGLPAKLDLKGLVWYPVPEFEQAGYRVPRTWDELVALTTQMVADGRTPWCMGFGADASTGWPGTDWIEGLVLQAGDPDLYDRWTQHEVRFDDPALREAFARFGAIAFGAGFVRGGSAAISRQHYLDAYGPLLAEPPDCWLTYQGSFLSEGLPSGAKVGVDVSYFPLPPLEPGSPAALFGGGTTVVAFTDRPEVRELITAVLDPTWGSRWAGDLSGQFLSANQSFDVERCRGAATGATAQLRVQLCEETRDLLATGQWRYDASDLMPPLIGALDDSGQPGAFLQGMVDYVDRGPESLPGILAAIETRWSGF